MGLSVLECKYTDKDPMYYNVQYYWGANSPATFGFMVPTVASAFLRANQDRLQQANGSAKVTHPFVQYGSPRWECPAEIDPALPRKQIYAPRKPASNANLPATPAGPTSRTRVATGFTTMERFAMTSSHRCPPNFLRGNFWS